MTLCVIPARGGSKRIPRKNVRPFFGKPMIAWSISAALESKAFDHIIVSTDDPEIAEIGRAAGATVPFMRPLSLSDDYTPTVPVIAHAIAEAEKLWGPQDLICCLYATAPFVLPEDILNARNLLNETGADYAFPVTSFPFPIQRGVRIRQDHRIEMFNPEHALTRSQDLEESYHDVGQFYWGRKSAWQEGKTLIGPDAVPLVIPRDRAQDIDTPEDWVRAEQLFTIFKRQQQKTLIRADAGGTLGIGHVMRCLTLADNLDGSSTFVCKEIQGHLGALIKARGHQVELLPADISPEQDAQFVAKYAQNYDLIVLDHYGLGETWARQMPAPVFAIDDIADRAHGCTLLLDQNLGRQPADYNALVSDSVRKLIGPHYALVRSEFADCRTQSIERRQKMQGVKRVLISLGGGDGQKASDWVINSLADMDLPQDLHVDVVVGGSIENIDTTRLACESLPYSSTFHVGVDCMAELMSAADLMIGSGGSTSWERCTVGLPSIIITLAANQIGLVQALNDAGAAKAIELGNSSLLKDAISQLMTDATALRQMSNRAAAVCDGGGVVRVVHAIRDILETERKR